MTETLIVTTERVDDIPLLLAHMERMGLPTLLDEHFKRHGNWEGISLGWTASIWMAHILSEGDHRLNHVEAWAQNRLQTLKGCTGQNVRALDFSDDRLAYILDAISCDERWAKLEAALNSQTIRVYDFKPKRVRVDSTTASGYWATTKEGLFQFGHSKDRRPDKPQVKVMLCALDPLGMPVATQVVSGEKADDPLYIPAICQVRDGLGRSGLLYVGDCKMMSLETRAFIEAGKDFYLGPLSKVHLCEEKMQEYLEPVLNGKQVLKLIYRPKAEGQKELIAYGYEWDEQVRAVVSGEEVIWKERRFLVRSLRQAKASEAALDARVQKAKEAVIALNERKRGKRVFRDASELRDAALQVIKQHRVEGLVRLGFKQKVKRRRVRRYGGRQGEVRVEREFLVEVEADEEALRQAKARLGWRVYATNQPADQLSLEGAVLAYREEYVVERSFGRLKGKPLSLSPMYLQDDGRATGLIRLLSVCLRVLSVFEFVVRRSLKERKEVLAGLYAGNPKRATPHPTAEAMLEAFKEITMSLVVIKKRIHRYITPLSPLQQKILTFSDFPFDIYTDLAFESEIPP